MVDSAERELTEVGMKIRYIVRDKRWSRFCVAGRMGIGEWFVLARY